MTSGSFRQIESGLRRGEDAAARVVFDRFVERLSALARTRLSAQARQKVDPEDVLQSVYKSFFRRQRRGDFDLQGWDSLWSLLVVLTIRKCRREVRSLRQQKRDATREVVLLEDSGAGAAEWRLLDRAPTPDEAVALTDLLEHVMSGLDEQGRAIVTLRLQGFTEREIAEQVGRTERTVQRIFSRVRKRLERLDADEH